MAWIKNEADNIEWEDGKGLIGGFGRGRSDSDQTFIGPVYSPNGTAYYIVVDNAGAVSATTTRP